MLLSMTGFGEARHQDDRLSMVAEVRSVNNRHFKLTCRGSEPYTALEAGLVRLVREFVRRGTVMLTIRVDRPRREEDYRLNRVALSSYRAQLSELQTEGEPPIPLSSLLVLPGVVEERRPSDEDPQADWPLISRVVSEALAKHRESRSLEGKAMAEQLLSLGRELSEHLEKIASRGPEVVATYQQRLIERVKALVQERVAIEPKDLIREVAILAERADISEEIIRLRAHFQQFCNVIDEPESGGRKLEFIVQEMGRETNTIGSKANDVEISRGVVEMKGLLEKVRELIQNVE